MSSAAPEETTTGIIREQGDWRRTACSRFPIIAVNDADTKHFFDNRYGTGQSTVDGIIRATNVLIAGKTVVVAGYGWCGKGVAMRMRGLGAQVIVTEIDSVKALEAVMDGFRVMTMDAGRTAGRPVRDCYRQRQCCRSRALRVDERRRDDGQLRSLRLGGQPEGARRDVRRRPPHAAAVCRRVPNLENKSLIVLGEGRLINLAAAEGHPASVMDMSFANQALSAEYLVKEGKNLKPDVYPVPKDIDHEIARLKLVA